MKITRRGKVALWTLLAALAVGVGWLTGPYAWDGSGYSRWEPTPPVQEQCEEDEPCWDCETMGNQLCGPQLTGQQGSDSIEA